MSASNPRTLWSQLAAAGLTIGEMPGRPQSQSPWYVRVMLCIAGLIAAAFLLGFVGVAFAVVMESKAVALTAGVVLMTTAYGLFRAAPRGDFVSMFALAVSFAGQALFVFAFFALFEHGSHAMAFLLIAAIEAVLALVMPHVIHRFVSAYAAALALGLGLESLGAGVAGAGLIAAAVAYVWLNEAPLARAHAIVAPIGYGLTVAFIHMEAASLFGRGPLMVKPEPGIGGARWLGEAVVAATLVVVVATLIDRTAWRWNELRTVLTFAAVVAIGAVSFKAPGIAGGLMIAVLGFANGNRVLTGVGVAALLFYVSGYYYQLNVSLLVKSAVLAATGAILLLARSIMLEVVMPKDGRHA